ncbi:Peptidyl-prolyl cis-trans isomerase FKBP62 [Camellia lanceoleosa]|uniref:Peptidyl-prolyl cis-trans isomerase FKBP62 n=1 Tax=Camellia lanceoleosa TaxID=1840588 RepID=A0ACC0HKJ0_9ERIC|nr:Peptidyl-prolyl cis-trans isomerase FKBP62 [Camellia lanceoleosa]
MSNRVCQFVLLPDNRSPAPITKGLVLVLPIGLNSGKLEWHSVSGYFCPALAKAVKTIKKGENVLLTVKPQYGFGEKGKPASVKLIGKLEDGTIFLNKGHDNDEELFEFKTDEEQVIEGLDIAVMTMKKGEIALLTVAPSICLWII